MSAQLTWVKVLTSVAMPASKGSLIDLHLQNGHLNMLLQKETRLVDYASTALETS